MHLSTMCHLFDRSARVANFVPISIKNTNSVEDDEILLSVGFYWIPFSGSRWKVQAVLANQKLWWTSSFSDRSKNTNFLEDLSSSWDLASCQVLLNSVQRFQRRSRKCLSQSEDRAAILVFSFNLPKKPTNFLEDVEILLPVKFCWIPISGFREEVDNVKK